jgi:protein SCO1
MKKPHWTALAAMLLVASATAVAIISDAYRYEPLPEYKAVPDFTLVERNGQTITRSDLDGHIWLADFIFTECEGACPLMTEQMSQLQNVLPDEIRLVSFTVDPTHDTPMVLATYAREHEADPDRWYFITGGRDEMYTLAREGFLLAVDDTNGDEVEPINHSTRFALVDDRGVIRQYYDGTNAEEVAGIPDDVRNLMLESATR